MVAAGTFAQTDTTSKRESDTIRIGNMIIIKKKKSSTDSDSDSDRGTTVIKRDKKPSKTSTNWWILDLGFANVKDETVYGSTAANAYLKFPPGGAFTEDDLNLNTGKSSNVNLWFFMQRLNITKGT